jgi:hypothetical protein
LKALTISQPYASLIASGEKWVESRRWNTSHIGLLAIHAGKGTQYLTLREMSQQGLRCSCIVAVCRLVGCVHMERLQMMAALRPKSRMPGSERYWSEILHHKHTEGPFCWVLEHVHRFREPIPCSGARGLWDWNVPDHLVDLLIEAIGKEVQF